MMTAAPTRRVWPWAVAFVVAMLAMACVVNTVEIANPVIAMGLMAWPVLLLIPMARAAMTHADRRGNAGEAQKRYVSRMLIVSLAYIGSLFLAKSVIVEGQANAFAYLLALVPGVAVAGYFWAMGRLLIEQQDEFLRMLMVRQSLIATAFALSGASIYGFLENFGLVPHIDAYWWSIAFFFGLGVGALFNRVSYGTTGECS